MKNPLPDLLDKIFELEGLITLALKRSDIPEELTRLIAKKGKAIAESCAGLSTAEAPADSIPQPPVPLPEPPAKLPEESEPEETDDSFFSEYSLEDDETQPSQTESQNSDPWRDEITLSPSEPERLERGKLIFSINEKFRFRKELFDNSDIDFNNTLALVASMETFEEAEDYFLNEEGFDMQNKVVKEFMEVIKRYFR